MKRLRLIALSADRPALLDALMKRGCVQLDEQAGKLGDPEWAALLRRGDTELSRRQTELADMKAALDTLQKHAKTKRPLFAARPVVTRAAFLDDGALRRASGFAGHIAEQARVLSALSAEEGRLQNRIAALEPWKNLDVPLDTASLKECAVQFGTCPGDVDAEELRAAVEALSPACALAVVSSDREQHCLFFMVHPADEEPVYAALKSAGFSKVFWKDISGTALENIRDAGARLAEIEKERAAASAAVAALAGERPALEMAADRLGVEVAREEAYARLISTDRVFFLEGWAPARALEELETLLSGYDCAYDAAEPAEGDNPPVLLQNSRLIRPFSMVTKMYSLPDYRNIDPNPLIALFYAVFFGMMFADVAYGLILVAIGLLVSVKVKPKGPMTRHMFPLMTICGVFSALWGVVFGGYFSDAVTVVARAFFGYAGENPVIAPLWVDPMGDPMTVLILALALGVVHILTGMAIHAYILIRDGKPLDAALDVLPWWTVFAGIAVLALGGTAWVMIAGFAALVLTQGRNNKGVLKKLFGGIASLYDITGYLSDILSYSRLMALGLAGGVLGSVFNTMGVMLAGDDFSALGIAMKLVSVAFFLALFAFGHVFNMAMSIIGTYVHAARLMYVEYFGKFYAGGGMEFTPLAVNTKYVDVSEKE